MISIRDRSMARNRALALALAASLLVHALALMLFRGGKPGVQSEPGARVLTARLALQGAAPEPSTDRSHATQPRPERTERAPPRPESRPLLTAPSQSPASASVPASAAQSPPATPAQAISSEPAKPAPAAAAAPRAPEVPAAAVPAPDQSVARAGSDADGGTLAQYRLALIGVARKYKRYPAHAMEKGWQGRVEVRLIIGSSGMTQSAAVRVSSGYEILDAQALDMVKKAKPLTPIPPALRGREFTVDIPVIFDLQSG